MLDILKWISELDWMYALLCLGAGSMGLLGLLLGAINSRKWDTIEEFESEIPLLYFLIIPPLIYIVISVFTTDVDVFR